MERRFFSNSLVREAEKGFSEKGIEKVNAKGLVVLVTNHFDERMESMRKFVWAGVLGIWAVAGSIILTLLF